MPHPLQPAAAQIDPDRTYTVADIADLLRMHHSSVHASVGGGWLPGGTQRPHAHGGRTRVWTGIALLHAAYMPESALPSLDHDRYAPATLYRLGCRCDACRTEHATDTRDWRRPRIDSRFPAAARERLIALVAEGMPLAEAAAEVDVSVTQVWGYYQMDSEFAADLDRAGEALCADAVDHRCSTTAGYRMLACRGTGCRLAKRASRHGAK